MKKFIAVYCTRNLFRPAIYKSQNLATRKIAQLPLAAYQEFTSQIEAEKFIFPKKIDYLKFRQQLEAKEKQKQKEKESLATTPPPPTTTTVGNEGKSLIEEQKQQKKKKIQLSKQEQEEEDEQEQEQEQEQEEEQGLFVEDQYTVDESQDYIHEFFITEKGKKNGRRDQIFEKKKIQKQEQLKKMPLFPQQPQKIIIDKSLQKQHPGETDWLSKQNLKKVYYDIIGYQSTTNRFQKSKCLIQKKNNSIYYAFFDGSSKNNPGPSGAGYIVTNANGEKVFQNSINIGIKTNNQAEYISFIFCLLDCKFNGIQKLSVLGDSQIVVNGVTDKYKITNKNIKQLNNLAKQLTKQFSYFQVKHVQRESNTNADKLSRLALKKKCLKAQ